MKKHVQDVATNQEVDLQVEPAQRAPEPTVLQLPTEPLSANTLFGGTMTQQKFMIYPSSQETKTSKSKKKISKSLWSTSNLDGKHQVENVSKGVSNLDDLNRISSWPADLLVQLAQLILHRLQDSTLQHHIFAELLLKSLGFLEGFWWKM